MYPTTSPTRQSGQRAALAKGSVGKRRKDEQAGSRGSRQIWQEMGTPGKRNHPHLKKETSCKKGSSVQKVIVLYPKNDSCICGQGVPLLNSTSQEFLDIPQPCTIEKVKVLSGNRVQSRDSLSCNDYTIIYSSCVLG